MDRSQGGLAAGSGRNLALGARMKALKIGVSGLGALHTDQQIPDTDTRFRLAKAAGFDFYERSPLPSELDDHLRAAEKYNLPVLSGGFFYMAGRDEGLLEQNMRFGQELGSRTHNIQIFTHHADGHVLSNDEVADLYMWTAELGDRFGLKPCFENHINMWSEHFGRVAIVAEKVKARGVPFHMTLDHSHIIFKMDNPAEQDIQNMRADVEAGRLELNPDKPGNVARQWIDANYVTLFQARPSVPNGPPNVWAKHPDGRHGRGVQYPWLEPSAGHWHSLWDGSLLDPWKTTVRDVLRHHATHAESALEFITMEMIFPVDYGAGAKYSIIDNNKACADWIREEWASINVDD